MCQAGKSYEEKAIPNAETMHDKIKRYQKQADRHNASQPYRIKGGEINCPFDQLFSQIYQLTSPRKLLY